MKANTLASATVMIVLAWGAIGQELPSEIAAHEIRVSGIGEVVVTAVQLAEAMDRPEHTRDFEAESRGVLHQYRGLALSQIVAMVDGPDASPPHRFDRELWERGYEISITAADGYTVTINTAEVAFDAMIIALYENGEAVTPRIVGDVGRGSWIRGIAEIVVTIPTERAASEAEPAGLLVSINEVEQEWSISNLEASRWFVEGKGSYTSSAGTTYTSMWGGVRLADFIGSLVVPDPEASITVIALDGYQKSYRIDEIGDTSDGVWILAFKQDGGYLPEDPGPMRTIKIGPRVPDIPGSSSARMIVAIEVTGTPITPRQPPEQ